MPQPKTADYGSWKSPLSSQLASDSAISIKRLYVDAQHPELLYWSELRPKEDGRTIVFSKPVDNLTAEATRWTQDGYNCATTVHEYGGAAFFVNSGTVYFMNGANDPVTGNADNKIYSQHLNTAKPVPITHGPQHFYRYADADFSKNPNFFFCIREDHTGDVNDPPSEAVNTIVLVDVENGEESIVVSGNNFYASPRVSPDGTKLCWFEWKHPNMPWDDTEVWIADVLSADGKVTVDNHRKVAGQEKVNFMEPRWTCDNRLMFIADYTGFWNLHIVDDLNTMVSRNVNEKNEEIGGPCWDLGYRSYVTHPVDKDLVLVTFSKKPALLNISTGALTTIDVQDFSISSCVFQPVHGNFVYMHAVNPIQPEAILRYEIATKSVQVLHKSGEAPVDPSYFSYPEKVTFKVSEGSAEAYGYFYEPKNPDFKPRHGTLPPLLIKIHGGPTGSASLAMDLGKQYFTSRGIAILDVDYRGSTGYGTAFRNALKKSWGIFDIEDTCSGALHMADIEKRVDGTKLLTSGGSAGGYTTLADLTFRTVFKAGASHYGISKLDALAAETHKFESQYCNTMIAEYPKEIAIYKERSPYYSKEKFNAPCAFFQGALDKVVPPAQSEEMFDVIKKKGLPCAYVLFPDEAHGFKKSENKQKALDGEFYFYSQILGFDPADEGIEIPIENLDTTKTHKEKKEKH